MKITASIRIHEAPAFFNQVPAAKPGASSLQFVWPLPFNLSGLGDPARSSSSSQYSSLDHKGTQATLRRQRLERFR